MAKPTGCSPYAFGARADRFLCRLAVFGWPRGPVMPTATALRVALLAIAYWALLLAAVSFGSSQFLLSGLILAGLPLAVVASLVLWRSARSHASDLAFRDDLTSLGNRRASSMRAIASCARATRAPSLS